MQYAGGNGINVIKDSNIIVSGPPMNQPAHMMGRRIVDPTAPQVPNPAFSSTDPNAIMGISGQLQRIKGNSPKIL